MNAIIETQNLDKIYGNDGATTAALKDVSINIQAGESVAIVGKSGSGKSTLLHILATLDRPTSGKLFVDGHDTTSLKHQELDKLRNEKFGFVFQQFFLNARNTCLENVVLPLVIQGVGARQRNERGLAMLSVVGLAEFAKQKANDLSGGQKQRLCIARALITNPQIIFADEPTGNLDSENGRSIIEFLFRLQREKGMTLIIVTHDHELALMCNRMITIKDGVILGETV
ncbi:MAG: ABC transporter ATP-binding protein [Candidatus Doudnabacteria bacterium]|nr:ABC transporter ATP-binding protein [Candidatus Doudnabacteria bacterium]